MKTLTFDKDGTKNKKLIEKRKKEESTSDESLASFLSDESNINIQDLIERAKQDLEEEARNEEIFSDVPVKNKLNKWVVVKFPMKTKVKRYVGKIVAETDSIPIVKFVRRVKKTSTFVWPQEVDESEVQDEDIVCFLPLPLEERRGGFSFPVSFSGFEIS